MSRARAMRAARRAEQFAKFRVVQLNLAPLVDTFVSVVFFSLTTATVGELIPVVPGVRLPASEVGANVVQQLTLGVGGQITLANRPLMTTVDAARAESNIPGQPLIIPSLYAALRQSADSIRQLRGIAANEAITFPLAIQADRSMRYDLLARVMQTARYAGFRNLSLQVERSEDRSAATVVQ